MEEQQWLSSGDPEVLLMHVGKRASKRKLRLFACACSRRVWHLLGETARRTLELMEARVDGAATREAWVASWSALWEEDERLLLVPSGGAVEAQAAVLHAARPLGTRHRWYRGTTVTCAEYAARNAAWALRAVAQDSGARDTDAVGLKERAAQAAMLREIIGNPFRSLTLDPSWRTPTVLALAEASYEHRVLPSGHLDPQRLAVLADALLDAGCEDAGILGHVREGEHVRGCHLIDAILKRS